MKDVVHGVIIKPINTQKDKCTRVFSNITQFTSEASLEDAMAFYYENVNNPECESIELVKIVTEYIPINLNMTFGEALLELNKGNKVTRRGWKRPDFWIELQIPDEFSKMTKPYLYMVKNGDKFPTDLSCESILAEDWYVLD